MKQALLVSMLCSIVLWAGPKQRPWQDAQVTKVEQSEVEREETEYRSSAPIGQVGQPMETGTKKRKTKIFTYEFTAGGKVYVAQVEKKPVEGLEKGATVKIAVQKEAIYIQTGEAKERKLDLLKTQ
jgi:hypothetical protein